MSGFTSSNKTKQETFKVLTLWVLAALLAAFSADAAEAAGGRRGSPARPPAYFEPNVGQAVDEVSYVARLAAYDLLLTRSAAVVRLPGADGASVISMRFAGANHKATIAPKEPAPGRVHYLLGSRPDNWRFDVARYRRVTYADLYDNITLAFYGKEDSLEFDFIVEPEGDPNVIGFDVEGADEMTLDSRGSIVMKTANGVFELQPPFAYQEFHGKKEVVDTRFTVDDRKIKFDVGKYDRSRTLIIDPVLEYATYLGGGGADIAASIAVDAQGRAHFAGTTRSADFPITAGQFAGGSCGGSLVVIRCFDAVVGQLNAAGTDLNWAVYLGGIDNEFAEDIAVDADGNVYVAGSTHSTDFPASPAAAQAAASAGNGRNADSFVAKFDSSGGLIYATRLGGDGVETAAAIAVNAAGEAFVAGHTNSRNFPVSNGALQAQNRTSENVNQNDVFVARLNAAGSQLIYSTYLGGAADERAGGIAVNAASEAFVSGLSGSADFPVTAGVLQGAKRGGSDGFVAKLAANGASLTYATLLGGTGDDSAGELALGVDGLPVIVGSTNSQDFPTTPGVLLSVWKRSTGYAAKLNADASALVFSTYLVGSADDLALDQAGNSYVGGRIGSSLPLFGGPVLPACDGSILRKLNPSANSMLHAAFQPGLGALSAGPGGSIFSAGTATSGSLATTSGAAQATFGGQSDLYLTRLTVPDGDDSISITCIEHGASFYPGEVAPGQIISLFGSGLGPAEPAFLNIEAGRVTARLGGTRVLFDGVAAPLLYAQWNQINTVVPYAVDGRSQVEVRVERDGVLSEPFTLPVTAAQPGLFTRDATGRGLAAIVNQSGSINGPASPAPAGSIVSFYGSGEGQTRPGGVDGLIQPESSGLPAPRANVRVEINGIEAEVLYAGAAPGLVSGVFQINARIPAGTASGAAPVRVTIGGRFNRQPVFVQVR